LQNIHHTHNEYCDANNTQADSSAGSNYSECTPHCFALCGCIPPEYNKKTSLVVWECGPRRGVSRQITRRHFLLPAPHLVDFLFPQRGSIKRSHAPEQNPGQKSKNKKEHSKKRESCPSLAFFCGPIYMYPSSAFVNEPRIISSLRTGPRRFINRLKTSTSSGIRESPGLLEFLNCKQKLNFPETD
jgi:hypothetical protein